MWPWGHLAFGYLLFSIGSRLNGRTPGDLPAIALAVGTQLPDVIDKTLAWVFHLLPQGYGPGHSVFVALPVGAAVLLFASWIGRGWTGIGFVVGWWSHLVGDVLVAVGDDNPYAVARVTWPNNDLPPLRPELGALDRIGYYADAWMAEVGPVAILIYVSLLGAVFLLWIVDGTPGLFRPWFGGRQ